METPDCQLTGDIWGTPARAYAPLEVLKEGELFLCSQRDGEITGGQGSELGLFYRDTRFLSRLETFLEGQKPFFLSSVTRHSHFTQVEFTNPELRAGQCQIPAQTIHVRTLRLLGEGLWQRVRLTNFNPFALTVHLGLHLEADFADLFECRGLRRERRGQAFPPSWQDGRLLFAYRGLDGVDRSLVVTFHPAPARVEIVDGQARVTFRCLLPPQQKVYLYLVMRPQVGRPARPGAKRVAMPEFFARLAERKLREYRRWEEACTGFTTSDAVLDSMLRQGITDLRALFTTYADGGSILEAGIPWYAAPFGRDALITAWQTLAVNPRLAVETLRYLAGLQGREDNPWRDEEPGKIPHELRRGEMAGCGEVPHTPYYGSVDATLWFVIVLAETLPWVKEGDLLPDLLPALRAALRWCREYGDLDGDGYIEYRRRSPRGLDNQGWKDSWDGVVNRQGEIPRGPTALVEVQAYYYLALLQAAAILERWGEPGEAEACRRQADTLRRQFLRDFWLEREGFLAFALDGEKRPVVCTTSNPGHCLFTGILPPEVAARVAERLFAADMYSGWGIRTMSQREKPYNPMSYHNGSVWPHDNSIIARGLREIGRLDLLERLAAGLFEAARCFPYYRLPELFCGFTRRGLLGPVHYPTACDPQAWAVGSIFALLTALLGIKAGPEGLAVMRPVLPQGVHQITVRGMRVGGQRVELQFSRLGEGVYAGVSGRGFLMRL